MAEGNEIGRESLHDLDRECKDCPWLRKTTTDSNATIASDQGTSYQEEEADETRRGLHDTCNHQRSPIGFFQARASPDKSKAHMHALSRFPRPNMQTEKPFELQMLSRGVCCLKCLEGGGGLRFARVAPELAKELLANLPP